MLTWFFPEATVKRKSDLLVSSTALQNPSGHSSPLARHSRAGMRASK